MASKLTGAASENIAKLKRYQAFETHVARLLGGWMPGVAKWEVKQRIGYHIWEDLQHSRNLRTRLWELRVTNPDRDVDSALLAGIEALAVAQHDYELIAGLYLVLKAELLEAYQRYVAATFDIYDHPSVIVLKQIIAATEIQLEWARRVVDELADNGDKRRRAQRWTQYAKDVLAAIGGIDGTAEKSELPVPPPAYALLLPFAEAKRDDRFEIQIGSPELPDENDQTAYILWQFSNYVQEMQAAETLATIMWETRGMDWEFYYDVARHCWDEVRHSELGEHRLDQLGYHIADFPSSIGSYAWRQLFNPLIRYCALTYIIEAGSFALKHASYQKYLENGDMDSAQPVMYDIIDETMHVRFGQKWVPPLMRCYDYEKSLQDLIEECRAIVASHSVSPAQRDAAVRSESRSNGAV